MSREKSFNLITLQLGFYETTDGITGIFDTYTSEQIVTDSIEGRNVDSAQIDDQ